MPGLESDPYREKRHDMGPCLLWSACDLPLRASVVVTAYLTMAAAFRLGFRPEISTRSPRFHQHHVVACTETTASSLMLLVGRQT